MSKYISTTDTAKLIRKTLKESFPGQKFSVRSKSYSGGSSIRVEWIGGPSCKQVEEVAAIFHGAGFDPMQDLKTHHDNMMNGEVVTFGADYVFFTRDETDEEIQTAIMLACQKWGYEGEYRVEDFRMGKLRSIQRTAEWHPGDDLQTHVAQFINNMTAYPHPAESKTRKSVSYAK